MSYSCEVATAVTALDCVQESAPSYNPVDSTVPEEIPQEIHEPETSPVVAPSVDRRIAQPTHNKLTRRTAVAVGLGFLATACNPISGADLHAPATVNPAAISTAYPHVPDIIALHEVNAANKDVAMQPARHYSHGVLTSKLSVEAGYGSGVFVDYNNTVIEVTAAHVDALTGSHCSNVFVDAQTSDRHSAGIYEAVRQSPADPEPPKDHYTSTYNDGHDVAVQLLSQTYHFGSVALPESALLADSPDLSPGSIVFAVNDEPTSTGVERRPNTELKDHTPAIYGLTVIGKEGNDYLAIDGVAKAYGSAGDNETRPGASGGPVYQPDGTLLGLTVGGRNTRTTSAQILKSYNVVVPEGKYHLTMIAPVTTGLLQQDVAAAKSSANCTTLPTRNIYNK